MSVILILLNKEQWCVKSAGLYVCLPVSRAPDDMNCEQEASACGNHLGKGCVSGDCHGRTPERREAQAVSILGQG